AAQVRKCRIQRRELRQVIRGFAGKFRMEAVCSEFADMKFHFRVAVLVTWAATSIPTLNTLGATNSWTNAVSGLWRIGTNWSSGQPPDANFGSVLITNANSKTVTIDAATPASELAIVKATISAPSGST